MLAFWPFEFLLRALSKAHLISAFTTSENASVNSRLVWVHFFLPFSANVLDFFEKSTIFHELSLNASY